MTPPGLNDRPRGGLAALCLAQTTSWGLLYYSLPVAVKPISADTGWSEAAITAAFSAGLIVSALAGIRVGRWLDVQGPRSIMTAGALVGAGALVMVGAASSLPMFVAAWLIGGFAQAAVFYQPAFAVITRWYGPERVRPLTILTLVAGFASTIYAPLTAFLIGELGWREAFFVLAAVLAAVTVPLHFFFLNARWTHLGHGQDGRAVPKAEIRAVTRNRRFVLLQLAMALTTFTLYAVTFNLIPLLLSRGMTYAGAAIAFGLVGAGQVLGRITYSMLAKSNSVKARTVAIIGAGAMSLWGLALVPGPHWALVAVAVLAGAVRGCHTLLQATAVADRWGTRNFGAVNGIFAAPMTAMGALAPAAGPFLALQLGGYPAMAIGMAALLSLAVFTAART